jgi:hypothetical protein
MPGANGIMYRSGHIFVSNTDRNRIVRIAILKDHPARTIETAAENLRADDFAFADSGALYIATHPANTILRLAPDGARVTIAGPMTEPLAAHPGRLAAAGKRERHSM